MDGAQKEAADVGLLGFQEITNFKWRTNYSKAYRLTDLLTDNWHKTFHVHLFYNFKEKKKKEWTSICDGVTSENYASTLSVQEKCASIKSAAKCYFPNSFLLQDLCKITIENIFVFDASLLEKGVHV